MSRETMWSKGLTLAGYYRVQNDATRAVIEAARHLGWDPQAVAAWLNEDVGGAPRLAHILVVHGAESTRAEAR